MSPHAVADELDALFAAPVCVTVRGEPLEVRGVRLEELPQVLRIAHAPDGTPLADAGMLELFGRLCGRPVEWLATLGEADADTLFAAVQSANRALYQVGEAAPRVAAGGRQAGWSAAVARLVECGHPLAAIRKYTLDQVDRLLQAHACNAADARLDDLSIARAAQADRQGYKRVVEALQRARASLD